MNRKILKECLRIAREKNSRTAERFRHFSLIVTDKIIEWAANRSGPPLVRYGYPQYGKLHAETEAYRRARGLLQPQEDFACVNIRLNRNGDVRSSCPCPACVNFLRCVGCSEVYFTTVTDFAFMTLKDLSWTQNVQHSLNDSTISV